MPGLTPDTHRKFHWRPPVVKYRPDSVKNILNSIWRLTNISIDLAFYAYFARDYELAMKILELDNTIGENVGQFIMHNAMAFGRSRKGGYANLLSFYYGSSMDIISDSVKDIVYTLLIGRTPGVSYNQVISYAEGEVVAKLTVEKDLRVVDLTDKYPVDVLAVLEDGKFKFMPGQDDMIRKGSTLYLRGFRENVLRLLSDHGVEYHLEVIGVEELEKIIRSLICIKDCTVLMLDLAHYVLMEYTPELKDEVEDLEIYLDWMHMETIDQLRSVASRIDADTFIGLTILLKELEDIADASSTISYIPSLQEEFPEDYRELFSKVFESVGEKVKTVTVTKHLNLGNLEYFLRKYGGGILAVKSGNTWIAYPLARELNLRPGDKVLVAYQVEFSEEVEALLKHKVAS